MSLSKQQMIGAVGGGVFVLGVLGLGWMLYSAWDARGTAEEDLASAGESFARYNAAAVYPSKASIESVKSNATSYAAWYESAVALAARGDKALQGETPPIFKQRLQNEVRRMLDLVGGVGGKIAAPTFLFGFEQFLGEGGVLPKEDEVPLLAVQLDTIAGLVDAFAEAGVYEVKSIVRVENKAEKAADDEAKSADKTVQKGGKADDGAPKTTKQTYQFEIAARPEALVATLNYLTSCPRFTVVRNLSFKESADAIVERLTAAEKAKADEGGKTNAGGGRRRGRGAAVQAAEDPAAVAAANRIVASPEGADPLTMAFTLDVYDFGRASAPAAGEKPAEGDEKPAEGGETPAAEEKAAEGDAPAAAEKAEPAADDKAAEETVEEKKEDKE